MRSNLDPFNERSDEDLWNALSKCHLSKHVADMPGGNVGFASGSLTDKLVAEKGNNFSVGQKQLLCLARALLRKSKILILDECTSAIDSSTDACIQDTVRTYFADVTVLSIAHRLKTVAFYDEILVMDGGCVAEFASPATLLSDPLSIFYGMAERSGDLDLLVELANNR